MSATKLRRVFLDSLDLSPDTDVEALEYRGIPQWDSVAHMRLVSDLEAEFDIMLDTEDVLGMSSFQKAKEILAKYDVPTDA